MSEREMFEKSFLRPKNYFKLSPESQWEIDSELGILDWKGEGLSKEDIKRFKNHYNREDNMGYKSTVNITRRQAIDRIIEIYWLIIQKNYKELYMACDEPDHDLETFVKYFEKIDISNLNNWSDKMLADFLDQPFFRFSMFDNYLIEDINNGKK